MTAAFVLFVVLAVNSEFGGALLRRRQKPHVVTRMYTIWTIVGCEMCQ